jgi:hypothetical protein
MKFNLRLINNNNNNNYNLDSILILEMFSQWVRIT